MRGKLDGIGDETVSVGAFPSGTHVCEVEVDPETGQVRLMRWSGVDDVGLAVNPLILHGQTHGAAAQGIGQALLEQCYYDRQSGQLLTASLMDYAMPRADDLPLIRLRARSKCRRPAIATASDPAARAERRRRSARSSMPWWTRCRNSA